MEKKSDPSLETYTNINSRWAVFLNRKHKNKKTSKRKWENLCDLRLG